MKCILAATDGSDGGDRAIDAAADLAHRLEACLMLVNIIGGYGLPGEVFRRFTGPQQAWLNELLNSHSAEILTKARERVAKFGVTDVRLESRTGDVAEAIIEIAKDVHADTIVVGKRGYGRVAGMLLGSVSQKLVSLAPCLVMVVP